jgi:hypothetical protein
MTPVQSPALASVTAGIAIPVNQYANNFNLGLAIVVPSGTNTSAVQYTLDDIYDPAVTPVWFTAAAPLTGVTASTAASFTIPCTAVRLNMTAWTSGSAYLLVVSSSK